MRCLALSAVVVCLSLARPAAANSCHNVENGSCWHATNQGAEAADIACSGYGYSELFVVTGLPPAGLSSFQFDPGWADGMGYFEPNVPIDCNVTVGNHSAAVHFSTLYYGDRVQIAVHGDAVQVTVRMGWTPYKERVVTEPLR